MNVQKLIKERRYVLAGIEPSDLIEFFQPKAEGGIRIPQFVGIPEDAVCTHVRFDFNLDMFIFKFYHEDFKKVEHGTMPPVKYTEHRILEFMEEKRQ